MKYLLLLLVIVAVAWWAFGRRAAPPAVRKPGAGKAAAEPQTMIACAHCGVHLPQADALADADGQPFCTEAHRLAGPR